MLRLVPYVLALAVWLLAMPSWAITLSDYQQSNWTDSASPETTTSVTWAAGDLIVVLGVTADDSVTLSTPTATGLTFSAVSGSPTTTNAQCKMYGWSATAASSGSSTISSTITSTPTAGIAAFVFSNAGGVGATQFVAGVGATSTQNLTRTGSGSHVVQAWCDWAAVNDTTVSWTPASFTQRINSWVSGVATYFVANWGNQGAAGTTSYGFTAGSGTSFSTGLIEVLDGAPPTIVGCRLLQDGTSKRLLQIGTSGRILQGGALSACVTTAGKGFPFYNDPFYPSIVR